MKFQNKTFHNKEIVQPELGSYNYSFKNRDKKVSLETKIKELESEIKKIKSSNLNQIKALSNKLNELVEKMKTIEENKSNEVLF